MNNKFRCNCLITTALDIIGDKWVLVLIKQMLLEGKKTFKDFTESDESIATNILASKLKAMEELGILTKQKHPNNRKINLYQLTERGIALAPTIAELALWSDSHLRNFHPTMTEKKDLDSLKENKTFFIKEVQERYRESLLNV